jgi:Pyruvate/2-oxoacid:ferredoxin oxidoreductase gamma subunit
LEIIVHEKGTCFENFEKRITGGVFIVNKKKIQAGWRIIINEEIHDM